MINSKLKNLRFMLCFHV